MEILLKKGANKECKDDFGITPLFVAAQYGQLESLRLLVSHGNNDHSFSFIVFKLVAILHQAPFEFYFCT